MHQSQPERFETEAFMPVKRAVLRLHDGLLQHFGYAVQRQISRVARPYGKRAHRDAALVMFRDITREEQVREQHYNLKIETVEMAQKVIEKQMMVAQEIAGLLGETTAETKVTLTKLRDSILNEEE